MFTIKRFSILVLLLTLVLVGCQSSPETTKNITNPESPALKMLLEPKNIAGEWKWDLIHVNQPGSAKWLGQENLSDSAEIDISSDFWLGEEKYYTTIYHHVLQYSQPVSNLIPSPLNSVFDGDSEIKSPNLESVGNTMSIRCFDSKIYYNCSISIRYSYTESYTTIITEKSIGTDGLGILINSIIKASDEKITDS